MKRRRIAVVFVLAMTLLSACGNDNAHMGMANLEMHAYADETAQADVDDQVSLERKLIKSGDISFETANVLDTKQYITTLVAESNGYISRDNVYDYNDRIQYHLSVRVPADQFDALLAKIEGNSGGLDSKNIYVQDVTEEFIDVQARIEIKKQLEARYKELLKGASQVGDILNIEKEMAKLRSEIEAIEGRIKYLNDNVAMGSLEVSFYQKNGFGHSFVSKVGEAIYDGWDSFLWFIIALAGLWPFMFIIAALVILVRRYKKRKKKTVE